MDHHFLPLSSISLMLCLCCFINFAYCVDADAAAAAAAAYLPDDISISCGTAAVTGSPNGRQWLADTHPMFASSVQINGKSTISSVARGSVSVHPYKTARISLSGFSYVFHMSPGEKFIRLHFNPTPYKGFQKYKDLFTVEAGAFTLLSNFSASTTADVLGLTSVVKEYCIRIEENQAVSIVFTPTTKGNSFAFLNGIEIITVPLGHSYFHDDGEINGAQVVGSKSQQMYVDKSTGLEMVRRVNIKRDGSVSSRDDITDILGMWTTHVPQEKGNLVSNITWNISLDVGFRYLARPRFSDVGLMWMQETGSVGFKLLIDEMIVYNSKDFVRERDTSNIIRYKDYMVMLRGQKCVKHHLLVSLQSYGVSIDAYFPFTGFEILKLSNFDNSLACPNLSPPALNSPSSTVQILLSVLCHRTAFVTISTTVIALANIIVHKLREIWEGSCTEEEMKPSARAERFCRRFSLAELKLATKNFSYDYILGKGGFGNVYKGLIDNGKEVAVKRLKYDSGQGAHEFLTEIETLSEMRHINLVSLIGYCNKETEMILVYEYMAGGTLGDHLYKNARKGTSCAFLPWKERLNICIGAGRGLDYLHTGHGVIHRDVKASNILLDENLTPKVSDFGLVKHENLSNLQSHVSTKVKGTFGYLDPTYFRTGKLTRKSDTYAFGVVLLEVLCGRPALDPRVPEAKQLLSKWAQEKIKEGEVEVIVDSNVIKEIRPNCLKAFVEIAERCLDEEPKKRPTMAQVVLQLESALEQQDILESSVPQGIMIEALCSNETNYLTDGEQAAVPSIDEPTPASPPKEQTNNQIVYDNSSYRMKEGRKVSSYKKSWKFPWDALWKRLKPSRKNEDTIFSGIYELDKMNLSKFEWSIIVSATENFSSSKLIGQSRYSDTYKGVLPESKQIVAVKQLSASMAQRLSRGLMINDLLIAQKLEHPNILKPLGYCLHKENIILVNEYMAKRSLYDIIFGECQQHLGWAQIFKIIMGFARGLAYLHQDSGMTIIHGNLNLTNILLDIDMNAKISNFGMAKLLEEDPNHEFERNKAVLGSARDYIALDSMKCGMPLTKSDVYSFGVVVLEIVSGKRCTSIADDYDEGLVATARNLWLEDYKKALDLVDVSIRRDELTPVEEEEALRYIKVGLLCTLNIADSRPTMPLAIKILKGEFHVDVLDMERLMQLERNGMIQSSEDYISSSTK